MPQPVIHLDRRVTIEEQIAAKDAVYGSNVPTWRVIDAVWAEVLDAMPSRSLALRSGIDQATQQARVRVRYDSRLVTGSRKRIRFGSRTLQVVGGPGEMGRREYLEFLVEEQTTSGGA